MLFPAKKKRAAHGPGARFPDKKIVIHLTVGLFRTPFPSPRVSTIRWEYADVTTKICRMDR